MADVRQEEIQIDRESLLQGILDHSPAYIYIKDLQGRYILSNRTGMKIYHTNNEEIRGKTLHVIFPKEIADIFEEHDNAVISSNHSLEFEETILWEGSPLTLLTELFLLRRPSGEPYAVCGISTDITLRKQAESAEHEQRTLAEALADTAALLNSTLDLNEVLERILANLERVVPHDAAAILLVDESQKCARVARHKGYTEHGQIEALLSINTPVDGLHETREIPVWMKIKEMEWVRSFAGEPIPFENRVIGYLCLVSGTPDFFKGAHFDRLRAFANQASIAIRNARLYEQAQELAALKERQRLAREMHDAVSQTLFSASVMAETLPRIWDRNPEDVKQNLVELQKLTRGALAEMRNLLVELRPQSLVNADLGDLMHQLADGLAGRSQIEVVRNIRGRCPLPAEVQTAFFRIAQETLNNVVKHSRADRVVIDFDNQGALVRLSISDNGHGFDPSRLSPGRLGFNIIHERADAIGAELKIASHPGRGTSIHLNWYNPQQ